MNKQPEFDPVITLGWISWPGIFFGYFDINAWTASAKPRLSKQKTKSYEKATNPGAVYKTWLDQGRYFMLIANIELSSSSCILFAADPFLEGG